MKYENAKDILPPELFAEVEKYAAGKLIYVPRSDARRRWGENSGSRQKITERNTEIRRMFAEGTTADELAAIHYLTPETIRNIVYSRKDRNMEFDNLFRLYSDVLPEEYTMSDDIDQVRDCGHVVFVKGIIAKFADRHLLIRAEDHVFATQSRVAMMDGTLRSIETMGYEVMHIVPNRYGELSRIVELNGHKCVVWAEEYDPAKIVSPRGTIKRGEDGRFLYQEAVIDYLAKACTILGESADVSGNTLFDTITCISSNAEDWVEEYIKGVLPARLRCAFPSLLPKYETIIAKYETAHDALREMWDALPRSVFHELFGWVEDIGLFDGDRLIGFRGYPEGGCDACICRIMSELVYLNGYGERDSERMVADILRDLRRIGGVYRFSDAEIAAALPMYRVMLCGVKYYYPDEIFHREDAEADVNEAEAMFDRWIAEMDTVIDFASAMR